MFICDFCDFWLAGDGEFSVLDIYHIHQYLFQGRELIHNVQKKVIISNQSLVLQKVTRSDSGVYTCTAHNAEGDGMSNSINLDVRCKFSKAFLV